MGFGYAKNRKSISAQYNSTFYILKTLQYTEHRAVIYGFEKEKTESSANQFKLFSLKPEYRKSYFLNGVP